MSDEARPNRLGPKKCHLDEPSDTHISTEGAAEGISRITGHSFRIGGTTELLRRGVPPDVVKMAGRWSSDSFLRYWRKKEDILPQHVEDIVISHRPRARSRRGAAPGGISVRRM
jgi:hypothetical protein